jgi:hypothetical protein
MKDNFNLYEWNKKRYLNELDIDQNINKDEEGSSLNITRGGDDPKMGAEEESDANVVGEGLNGNIDKIEFTYIENSGKLYKVEVFAKGKKNKLFIDDANGLLKMLSIQDELPSRINNDGDENLLDSIVKQLQDQDIDASWNDAMDIS